MRGCIIGLKNSLSLLKVCVAMYHLNRRAKGSGRKDEIYKFKSLLVRWLYEHGYCGEARRQDQVLPCWHTWEYVNDWTNVCEKCNNTGIFRQTPMFRFVFHVEDKTFIWHQPADLVDWKVQETGEPLPGWEGVSRQFGGQVNPTDLWSVRWFLILRGLLPIRALALEFLGRKQGCRDEEAGKQA